MPRLFVGNFDFELHLAGRHESAPRVKRVAAELTPNWIAATKPGDAIWLPETVGDDFLHSLEPLGITGVSFLNSPEELTAWQREANSECCPWGWTESVLKWAKQHQLLANAPAMEITRTANSRNYSFEWEEKLDYGLPLRMFQTEDELVSHVRSLPDSMRWVIKAEFGMSGRERCLGAGPELPANILGWCAQRFDAGQRLFWEPWVTAISEAGMQFFIPPQDQGPPRHLGTLELLSDHAGQYRGSVLRSAVESDNDWKTAEHMGLQVAEDLQSQGYFGPLGIDAMRYRDADGTVRIRPLQDINARWTMGRLAWEWRRKIPKEHLAAWLHLSCPAKTKNAADDWWQALNGRLPDQVSMIQTSPKTLDSRVCRHASVLVLSTDRDALETGLEQFVPGSER